MNGEASAGMGAHQDTSKNGDSFVAYNPVQPWAASVTAWSNRECG